MKKIAPLALCALAVLITSSCSKKDLDMNKIKDTLKKHKILSAAIASGVAVGSHYVFDAFGIKHRHNKKNASDEVAVPEVIETASESVDS